MFYLSEKILQKYSGFSTEAFVYAGLLKRVDKITLYSYKWYMPNKVIKFNCVVTDDINGDTRSFGHSESYIDAVKFLNFHYRPELHI